MLFDKRNSRLFGLQFWDKAGVHLLSTSNLEEMRTDLDMSTKMIEIAECERLVGVRSGQHSESYARHYDF